MKQSTPAPASSSEPGGNSQKPKAKRNSVAKWRIKRDYSVFPRGQKIPENVKRLIAHHLEEATFPTKHELARALGVSYETVNRIYRDCPEVQEKWAQAMERKLSEVEMAGFEMAIKGEHPIAKEKMIEFILTHHKPETYGENANQRKAVATMPKIIIPVQIVRSQNVPTVASTIGASESAANGAGGEVIDV